MGACAIGFGKAVPGLVVENDDLVKLVPTSNEWIETRTGISSRRVSVNETVLDLGVVASAKAMGLERPCPPGTSIEGSGSCEAPIDPASIDLVILTTITPDVLVPSNAAALKKALGLDAAVAFDVNAACTGFVYGVALAESMMAASHCDGGAAGNRYERALVVSSERLTRITDWQDRNTCVLFGDGAGAMVLEWRDGEAGVLSSYLRNDDDEANSLTCRQSYSSPIPFDASGVVFDGQAKAAHDAAHPDAKEVDYSYIASLGLSCDPATWRVDAEFDIDDRASHGGPEQVIYMNGQKVFKFAARAMERAVREALERASVALSDVKLIVPHQANLRIIEFAAKRLESPLELFQVSIDHTGNTSSSCLPMALEEAVSSGRASKGDIVVLVAFGGGLTSGAVVMRL